MAISVDFDFGDINLNDDWDAEIPGGVDEAIMKVRNQDLEEVLVVGVSEPENEEIKVEIINDWKHELEELIDGGNMVVLSEWTPEMGSDEHSLSSSAMRRQRKECPICLERPSCKLDRHVISNHLPWFAYPRHACWECQLPVPQISRFPRHQAAAKCFGGEFRGTHEEEWVGRMNYMLRYIAEALQLPGVPALLQFIRASPEMWPDYDVAFNEDVKSIMDIYQRINGFEERAYQMSPPNCVAALLHWRTLLTLIGRLPPQAQAGIRSLDAQCTFLGEPLVDIPIQKNPVAADAHCHIDLLLKRTRSRDYAEAAEGFTFPDMEVDVNIIIPCYAFPTMFPTRNQLEQLPPSAQNFAAGFHPRSARSEFPGFMATFRKLVVSDQAVAVGEVGLDYTRGVPDGVIRKQHRLLQEVTQMAFDLNKPMVIHCRSGDIERNATVDCLTILRQILPRSYPVYVHCFTGGFEDFKRWIQAFPNAVFGFTGALLHPKKRHPELVKVVASLDMGRILVETDAPLLLPPKYHGLTQISNPYMVVDIAAEIAAIRHIPTTSVLAVTHRNTRRFFNLVGK